MIHAALSHTITRAVIPGCRRRSEELATTLPLRIDRLIQDGRDFVGRVNRILSHFMARSSSGQKYAPTCLGDSDSFSIHV
jgi:hypothetical protein